MIYEQSSCFDQNTLQEGLVQSEDGFSKTHLDEQSYTHQNLSSTSALEMEIQNQLNLEVEHCYNNNNNEMQGMIDHTRMVQEIAQNPSWQEMSNFHGGNGNQTDHVQNGHFTETLYPTTPDLLNMFPLPRCSTSILLPNSSINFTNSAHNKSSSSFLASLGLLGHDLNSPTEGFDPLLPLNLQPQPPMLKELFHSLPFANHGSLFDERDSTMNGGLYQDGDGGHNGVFMFTAGEMDCLEKNRDGKDTKHFATERHRRVLLNDKFQALRKLIPNPTKNDRASIVGDAINYINELKRTLNELKILIEKKRCARERLKRPKPEDDGILEQNGSNNSPAGEMDHPYNGSSLRSSWLHRKSKNIEVDVRIIDDEVNVKLVQQKRVNCLLFVSRVLDELQLDLHHVAGGLIGDYYSFLFNSKISEGSIVYASAIADKLIEVVDKQYAAIPPSISY